nr:MAG TPA: hypothetical protein [Bacteriophage sp.]
MAKGLENLTNITDNMTHSDFVEAGKKGGKASGEARRRRKLMREQMEILLTLPIKSRKIKEQLNELGIDDTELNNQMALVVSMYQKALKGDTRAFEILRDTIGEKPVEVQEVHEIPQIIDDIK